MVAVMSLTCWRTCSAHTTWPSSPFCKEVKHGLICTIFNTTEDVVTQSGPAAVATQVATQHPVILCQRSLLRASNDSSPTWKTTTPAGHPRVTRSSKKGRLTPVRAPHASPSGSGSARPRNASAGARHQPQRECAVNVTVQHSTINTLQGDFVAANVSDSKIGNLRGSFVKLDTRSTVVTNLSVSGEIVRMEDTEIKFIQHLTAKRMLEVSSCRLGRVSRGGLLLFSPVGREEPSLQHTLRDMTVQRLQAGALVVVQGRANITNMTVAWLARDAVTVRSSGELTLTDTVFHCDPLYYCLNLEMGARLVLRNVTVRNKTIAKMALVATSKSNMYPLFALVSVEDRDPMAVTFSWYWVIIMTVCGVMAGMVIGSALVWKRPSMPTFSFTLSDLLSHDRAQQEGNVESARDDHADDLAQRPSLIRQDSGLTSSSFASYRPYQTSTCRTEIECDGASTSYTNALIDD